MKSRTGNGIVRFSRHPMGFRITTVFRQQNPLAGTITPARREHRTGCSCAAEFSDAWRSGTEVEMLD